MKAPCAENTQGTQGIATSNSCAFYIEPTASKYQIRCARQVDFSASAWPPRIVCL